MNREFWLKRLAVVAAIVLTAIGGVGLWNSVSDDSSTTAAAAVKEACNKIELSGSYDAAVVGRTRENGVVIEGPDLYVMEFNGDDLHSIAQVKTGTGPREWKVVDREYYFRNSKGWFLNVGLEFTPIIPNCSKLSNMEDQGEETSDDGAKVRPLHGHVCSRSHVLSRGQRHSDGFLRLLDKRRRRARAAQAGERG